MFETVKANNPDALYFLKCYCPRCGGSVFVGDLCFLCDWLPQTPGQIFEQERGEVASICGGCGHFFPSRLNPSQGFGRCALEHLSKRPGAYPNKSACLHFEATAGEAPTLRLAQ